MKKNILILSIIGAIVICSVYYIKYLAVPVANEPASEVALETNETTVVGSDQSEFSGVGTLKSLQARDSSLECSLTYDQDENGTEVVGTYFIANDKVRGDFIVPAPEMGGEILTSVIVDGDMMYLWSDIGGQLFGTKTMVSEETGSQMKTPVPDDAAVRYSCKPWTQVDGSVFVPPSEVLFQDTADLMNTGMEYGTVYEEGQ